jgi:hypothetical protein
MISPKEKEILCRDLRSRDEELGDIVYVTRFASAYYFSGQWDKLDIEGTFVMYTRTGEPPVKIHIYNRKRMADLSLYVDKDTGFDVEGKFITIQSPHADGIYGLWFHNEAHPENILGNVRLYV